MAALRVLIFALHVTVAIIPNLSVDEAHIYNMFLFSMVSCSLAIWVNNCSVTCMPALSEMWMNG